MTDRKNALILKILAGSQYGAEVALDEGSYSFGSGAEADIQLADVALAGEHGAIRLSDGRIELRARGGEIRVGEDLLLSPDEEDWREIAQLDVISAGTVRFAIGSPASRWGEVLPKPAAAKRSRAGGRTGRSLVLAMAGVAGLVAAGYGGIHSFDGASGLQTLLPQREASPLARVEQELAALPFDHALAVDQAVDGTVAVRGYVQDAAERRAVGDALARSGAAIERNVWALDALAADVRGLIEAKALPVSFDLSRDGHATLSGKLLDPAQSADLVGLLEAQVFGLAGVTSEIRTAQTYLEEVGHLLDQLALNGLVIARLNGPLIEVTGVIPSEKADNWVGFIRAYAGRFAADIPLRSFVTLEGREAEGQAPLILDGGAMPEIEGRRLPASALQTGPSFSPEAIFSGAGPAGAEQGQQPAQGAALAAAQALGADLAAAGLPNGDASAAVSPELQALVRQFAQDNPDTVGTLLASLTNGQLTTLDQLTSLTQEPGAETAPVAAQLMSPAPLFAAASGLAGTAPKAGSSAPGQTDAIAWGPGASGQSASAARASAPDSATGPISTTALTPEPARDASSGYVLFPTSFVTSSDQAALIASANAAISGKQSAGSDVDLLAEVRQAGLSPRLVSLSRDQQRVLSFGQSLLAAPAPLPAQGLGGQSAGAQCWPGALTPIEMLPQVILWLDMLSLGIGPGLEAMSDQNQLLLMETALNPDRLRACLRDSASSFGRELLGSSVFLSEISRNPDFGDFLFRDVPRSALQLQGVSLTADRYLQLQSRRKLVQGSAPDAASRVMVIGDTGAVLRSAAGFSVLLYPRDLAWRVTAEY